MGNNIRQFIYDFHTNQTQIADGKEMLVNANMCNMVIAVTGDATNFNLVVEAKSNDSDTYSPIAVGNMETIKLSSNITANGKYEMSLDGLVKIKIRLSAIQSGAVTVRGTITN